MSDSRFLGSYTVSTNAGMCGLWQPEHFAHVSDLDAWETEVSEEAALERCIRAGVFVPINVGGDGVFQVTLRAGERTSIEEGYTLVSSEPYLFISKGSIALGGIEDVGGYIGGGEEVPLVAERYMVTVHLIDWKVAPESVDPAGRPNESSLPDFVIEIRTEKSSPCRYRTSIATFDRSR